MVRGRPDRFQKSVRSLESRPGLELTGFKNLSGLWNRGPGSDLIDFQNLSGLISAFRDFSYTKIGVAHQVWILFSKLSLSLKEIK
ncbi:MAG: hypothetical protein BWK78_04080 [Thiotrichaceae bacterium IS1]|nr:MAG: hypothetical protein BWK78_04080 [Thiotrichaceae bacterium IS1]